MLSSLFLSTGKLLQSWLLSNNPFTPIDSSFAAITKNIYLEQANDRFFTPIDSSSAVITKNIYPEQDWDNTILDESCFLSKVNENMRNLDPEDYAKALLHTNTVESVFVAAKAQNFALGLIKNATTTKILLNDLCKTNVKSISLIEMVKNFAPLRSTSITKDGCSVPFCPKQKDILNFHLALGL